MCSGFVTVLSLTHLDQDRRVAALLEHRRRRAARRLDARFGVEMHEEQDVRIEQLCTSGRLACQPRRGSP